MTAPEHIMTQGRIVAIDFETANYRAHSAIALGLAVIEGGMVTQTRSWMIRPPEMWFIPAFIDIHGITADDVRGERDFSEIWPELPRHKLNVVCDSLGIALDHHNASSDALACAKIYLASLDRDQARSASAAISG